MRGWGLLSKSFRKDCSELCNSNVQSHSKARYLKTNSYLITFIATFLIVTILEKRLFYKKCSQFLTTLPQISFIYIRKSFGIGI